ncbi:hypothetical protein L3Q82_021388, partial [Scortum barcoo]
MRPLLLASALIAGVFGSSAASPVLVPYHAFCRTLWLFGLPCADVGTKLVQQIQAFSPLNSCKKCHYITSERPRCLLLQLVSATNASIQAHHTSSDKLHVESIELTLHTTILTASCRVSVSHTDIQPLSLLLYYSPAFLMMALLQPARPAD